MEHYCQIMSRTMPNSRTAFQLDAEKSHSPNGENIPNPAKLSDQERHRMLWDCIFCNYQWINDIVQDFAANPFSDGNKTQCFIVRPPKANLSSFIWLSSLATIQAM